jgi:hypothetical protein
MRRVAGALSVVGVALAALAPPAGAQVAVDPPYVCPQGFVPILTSPIAPPGTDRNGNFIVCAKPADGMIVWHDDLLDQGGG